MKTIFTLLTLCFFSFLHAQQVQPDSTFGINGQMLTNIGGDDFIYCIVAQNDGKIIAAGSERHYYQSSVLEKSALTKYLVNGFLDKSFGQNGKISLKIGKGFSEFYSVGLQSNGKIIAAGYANFQGLSNQPFLMRFSRDGNIDSSFGVDGIAEFNIPGKNSFATSIVIDNDDNIIIGGYALSFLDASIVVSRFKANGKIDSSFNNKGWMLLNNGQSVQAKSIALQVDGKIVLTGVATSNSGSRNIIVARVLHNGRPDNTFGTSGINLLTFNNFAEGKSITMNGNKILVAGWVRQTLDNDDFVIIQLNNDGNLDAAFGDDGIVHTDFGYSEDAFSLQVDNDSKILVAGRAYDNQHSFQSRVAIARYHPNGSLDESFGTHGRMLSAFFNRPKNAANSMILQPFGRIIIAGSSGGNQTGSSDFALARFVEKENSFLTNYQLIKLTVFPNPVNNILQIKLEGFSQGVEAKLFSKTGRLFLQEKFQQVPGKQSLFSLNTGSIPNGIYTLFVSDEKGNSKSAEIIVQH